MLHHGLSFRFDSNGQTAEPRRLYVAQRTRLLHFHHLLLCLFELLLRFEHHLCHHHHGIHRLGHPKASHATLGSSVSGVGRVRRARVSGIVESWDKRLLKWRQSKLAR